MALTLVLAVLGFTATAASAWHRPTHAQQQAISRAVTRKLKAQNPAPNYNVKVQRISTRGPWASVFIQGSGAHAGEVQPAEGVAQKVHGAWRLARAGLGAGAPCGGIPTPVLQDLGLTGFCHAGGDEG